MRPVFSPDYSTSKLILHCRYHQLHVLPPEFLSGPSTSAFLQKYHLDDIKLAPVDVLSADRLQSEQPHRTSFTGLGSHLSPVCSPDLTSSHHLKHTLATSSAIRNTITSSNSGPTSSDLCWTSTAMVIAAAAAVAVASASTSLTQGSACSTVNRSPSPRIKPECLSPRSSLYSTAPVTTTVTKTTGTTVFTSTSTSGTMRMASDSALTHASSQSTSPKRFRFSGPETLFTHTLDSAGSAAVTGSIPLPTYPSAQNPYRQQSFAYDFNQALSHLRQTNVNDSWSHHSTQGYPQSSDVQVPNSHELRTRHSMVEYPIFSRSRLPDDLSSTVVSSCQGQHYTSSGVAPSRRSTSLTTSYLAPNLVGPSVAESYSPQHSFGQLHSSLKTSRVIPESFSVNSVNFDMNAGKQTYSVPTQSGLPFGASMIHPSYQSNLMLPHSLIPAGVDCKHPSSSSSAQVDTLRCRPAVGNHNSLPDNAEVSDGSVESETDIDPGTSQAVELFGNSESEEEEGDVDDNGEDEFPDDDDDEDEVDEDDCEEDYADIESGGSTDDFTAHATFGGLNSLHYSANGNGKSGGPPHCLTNAGTPTKKIQLDLSQLFAVATEHDQKLSELVQQFIPQIKMHLTEVRSCPDDKPELQPCLDMPHSVPANNNHNDLFGEIPVKTEPESSKPQPIASLSTPEPIVYNNEPLCSSTHPTSSTSFGSTPSSSRAGTFEAACHTDPEVSLTTNTRINEASGDSTRSYLEQLRLAAQEDTVVVGVGTHERNSDPTAAEHLLCSLCCLLENCLFYLVDWMGQTELFKIIPVGDKMQLLNSSWSEIVLLEYLHCYLFHNQDNRDNNRPVGHSMTVQPCPSPPIGRPHFQSTNSPNTASALPHSVSREVCDLMDSTLEWFLGATDFRRKLEDLITQFERLKLDQKEFTCLKFIALFNPAKHDLALNSSQSYVMRVQGRLCRFLLRRSHRASRISTSVCHTSRFNATPSPWSSSCSHEMTTTWQSSTTDRFANILLQLTEVKYLAFQLESFLLARYRTGKIPHESLLTEMLLTKRARSYSTLNSSQTYRSTVDSGGTSMDIGLRPTTGSPKDSIPVTSSLSDNLAAAGLHHGSEAVYHVNTPTAVIDPSPLASRSPASVAFHRHQFDESVNPTIVLS
ncbi:hypothetical protein P879_05879 [Paragonimus westermani]|uniref:NR LBD domain-containing protein n=1 Tax=Paragonimus westermani TaxID=34504 RepID=A0A8T0D8R5_9TREM|nr:hypothetical protein P879_05879 [Paragonimus westermani]